MQLWKLGCRWGPKTPLFYDFISQRNIVIGWVSKDYQIGDWLLITDGHTVLSFAEIIDIRDCVLNHPELKEKCDNLEIPFTKDLFIYKANFLHLKTDDRFSYPLQQGIVMVQASGYINKFKNLRMKYTQEQELEKNISLLKYKKQIILQGPPGTGKTKLAKEIAQKLVGLKTEDLDDIILNENDIITALKNVHKITTVAGNVEYEIVEVDEAKKSIVLKKSTETEAETTFLKVIEFYSNKYWQTAVANNDDRRAAAIAGYIFENRTSWQRTVANDQIKIIQFHPSYSYEDFVRGITAKPNQGEGGGVIYKVENKILAVFAETALRNYKQNTSSSYIVQESLSIFKQQLELFIEQVNEAIDKDGYYAIGSDTTAKIVGITDTSFIYSFDKRPDIRYQLLYSDLVKIDNHPQKVKRTLDVRDIAVGYLTMIGKHPYYFKVYNLIKSIEVAPAVDFNTDKPELEVLKNYILIIDEINRANLSSVLGELIYALEYRGEEVESMYALDENNKILLPPNLYIIGTMNTADRSVGHIDYAIRRRFAFVDILPKDLSTELGDDFMKGYYDRVHALFYENKEACLSGEFESGQVCLGHSYFIQHYKKDNEGKNTNEKIDFGLRLKYEIVPILEEYVRDGVLKNNNEVQNTINELKAAAGV